MTFPWVVTCARMVGGLGFVREGLVCGLRGGSDENVAASRRLRSRVVGSHPGGDDRVGSAEDLAVGCGQLWLLIPELPVGLPP